MVRMKLTNVFILEYCVNNDCDSEENNSKTREQVKRMKNVLKFKREFFESKIVRTFHQSIGDYVFSPASRIITQRSDLTNICG